MYLHFDNENLGVYTREFKHATAVISHNLCHINIMNTFIIITMLYETILYSSYMDMVVLNF